MQFIYTYLPYLNSVFKLHTYTVLWAWLGRCTDCMYVLLAELSVHRVVLQAEWNITANKYSYKKHRGETTPGAVLVVGGQLD